MLKLSLPVQEEPLQAVDGNCRSSDDMGLSFSSFPTTSTLLCLHCSKTLDSVGNTPDVHNINQERERERDTGSRAAKGAGTPPALKAKGCNTPNFNPSMLYVYFERGRDKII